MGSLTKREKKLIFALINICLFLVFYYVISTNRYKINENRENISLVEQQQINRILTDINNHSQVLTQINEYEIRNLQMRTYFLPIINNQHIHMYVEHFLSQHNLSTINLNIMEIEHLEESEKIVDLTANVNGDIFDFYNFLLELESQDNSIDVRMLDIVRYGEDNYSFSFTLRFFMTEYGDDSNFDISFESEQYEEPHEYEDEEQEIE